MPLARFFLLGLAFLLTLSILCEVLPSFCNQCTHFVGYLGKISCTLLFRDSYVAEGFIMEKDYRALQYLWVFCFVTSWYLLTCLVHGCRLLCGDCSRSQFFSLPELSLINSIYYQLSEKNKYLVSSNQEVTTSIFFQVFNISCELRMLALLLYLWHTSSFVTRVLYRAASFRGTMYLFVAKAEQ